MTSRVISAGQQILFEERKYQLSHCERLSGFIAKNLEFKEFSLEKVAGAKGYAKWEYRLMAGWLTEMELNALGAEDWELVSVIITPAGKDFYYVFKRQKS